MMLSHLSAVDSYHLNTYAADSATFSQGGFFCNITLAFAENEWDSLTGVTPKGRTVAMLVLSRKKNESIVINNDITITVVEIRGDKVRLGIIAPKDVPVHRQEIFDAIHGREVTTESKPEDSEPQPA
jgi:carbon storage regulator